MTYQFGDKKKLFVVDKGYFPDFYICDVLLSEKLYITVTLLSRKSANSGYKSSNRKCTAIQVFHLVGDVRLVYTKFGPEPSSNIFDTFNLYENKYYFGRIKSAAQRIRIRSFKKNKVSERPFCG